MKRWIVCGLVAALATGAAGCKKKVDVDKTCHKIMEQHHSTNQRFLDLCKQSDNDLVRCMAMDQNAAKNDSDCVAATMSNMDRALKLGMMLAGDQLTGPLPMLGGAVDRLISADGGPP